MSWKRLWTSGTKLRLRMTPETNLGESWDWKWAQKKFVLKLNPSTAPHFGGIWERLVQSWKKVMIANLDKQLLPADEVLSNTMYLIEQTFNARPLRALSEGPEDLTALTQNHFLQGRENASATFMLSNDRYHDLRKSFKTSQAYAEIIWKRLINFHNGSSTRIPSTVEPETKAV